MWKVKVPVLVPMETRYRPILEKMVPPEPMSQFSLRRGSPEEEFPDLCGNSTWMGRILTLDMYRRQFNRCTHSGVIFDDVIRPGLEEPARGHDCSGPVSVGCVAGDAHSYILFCDFFDRVIEAYHLHRVSSCSPQSDLNHNNLKGVDDLDGSYIKRCEVSVVRAVEDFCFPTHCSRGERRRLLTLAKRVLQRLEEEVPGRFILLEELDQDQQRALSLSPPSPSQQRMGVARDWPDGRAVWVSKDGYLVIWVNMDDHLKLVSTQHDANIMEVFKRICVNMQKMGAFYRDLKHPFIWKQQIGWVTSSPANVGTGMRVVVHLRLQHLPGHGRLQDVLRRLRLQLQTTESSLLCLVSNTATFGLSEVELTQLVVDGVKLLVFMEKKLEVGGDIDDLVPTQK